MWNTGKGTSPVFTSFLVDATWKRKKKVKCREGKATISWVEDTTDFNGLSSTKKIFSHDALHAECYAILEGMKEAGKISRNVIEISYCKEVMEAIKIIRKGTIHILPIIKEIRSEATKLDYLVCIKVHKDLVNRPHNLAQQERKGP